MAIPNPIKKYDMNLYEVKIPKTFVSNPSFSYELVESSNIQEVINLRNNSRKKEFLDNIKKGAICMVAKRNDDVVGYGWIKSRFHNDNFVKIESDNLLLSNFFVKNEYRGNSIMPSIINELIKVTNNNNGARINNG